MRTLKMKIGLLVVALSFVFVGVLSLAPVETAKADTVVEVEKGQGFEMLQGAAVKATSNEDKNFRGISWVTSVSSDFYTSKGFTPETAVFGAIVAPTASIVGELTHATSGIKDIEAPGVDASENDATYRTIIDFSQTPESKLQAAYKLELTARAYVKAGDTYYYAETGSSRSARQVAAIADACGDLDVYDNSDDDYVQAVGGYIRQFYLLGTGKTGLNKKLTTYAGREDAPLVDLEHLSDGLEYVFSSGNPSASYTEICIGAQKVADKSDGYYDGDNKTLDIPSLEGFNLPAGETYLIFFGTANTYTYPMIVASKVLDDISDFQMFNKIRLNYTTGSIRETQVADTAVVDIDAECKLDGYYVLKNNIDSAGTLATYGSQEGWRGIDNWVGTGYGLTGTFNGFGHYIDGLDFGSNKYYGLFGLINGGTVKNIAITNFVGSMTQSYNSLLAYNLIDPTIKNVYIKATNLNWTYEYIFGRNMTIAAHSKTSDEYIQNIVLDYTYGNGADPGSSALRCGLLDPAQSSFSGVRTSSGAGRLNKAEGEEGATKKSETIIYGTAVYAVSNLNAFFIYQNSSGKRYVSGYGENQRTAYVNGKTGHVNMGVGPKDTCDNATSLETSNRDIRCYKYYHYDSLEDMAKAKSSDISSAFTNGNTEYCFSTTTVNIDGKDYYAPLWNNLPAA